MTDQRWLIHEIVGFLVQIGLRVGPCELEGNTFLPGIEIQDGTLWFDPDRLLYPGDLLYEAGHLALLSATERERACDADFTEGGHELAAIAWSYAVCRYLELPLEILFHRQGYRGDADGLIENFKAGRYLGVPILVWKGMTESEGSQAFPAMQHWLCPQ